MPVLDHERLEVYGVARELSREVARVVKPVGGSRRDLVDQVLRATASVPLNIAEGSGERTPARRAYFYRVARGSATEVSAALDHMVDMNLLPAERVRGAKDLAVRIVAMLVRLTSTPEGRPARKAKGNAAPNPTPPR